MSVPLILGVFPASPEGCAPDFTVGYRTDDLAVLERIAEQLESEHPDVIHYTPGRYVSWYTGGIAFQVTYVGRQVTA